jgi:hypothetical protein
MTRNSTCLPWLDERAGVSAWAAGEPIEVSALRIARGHGALHPTHDEADRGERPIAAERLARVARGEPRVCVDPESRAAPPVVLPTLKRSTHPKAERSCTGSIIGLSKDTVRVRGG